jgi:hypothetical protein
MTYRQWAVRIAPVALLLALAVAGCAGHGNAPGVATAVGGTARLSPTPSLSDDQRRRQFAQCMRDHGVDIPDPAVDGGHVQIQANAGDKALVGTALQACQSLLPGGTLGATPTAEELAAGRAFAQCMRDHGVHVPDPDPNGGPGFKISTGPGEPGKNSPQMRAAIAACQHDLPGNFTSADPGSKG